MMHDSGIPESLHQLKKHSIVMYEGRQGMAIKSSCYLIVLLFVFSKQTNKQTNRSVFETQNK